MSFSRSAYAKSCDGVVPQETDFKRLALVLSSASACKKLAMVSSLKTMFQKRPMAPTFLSSSTTRRHNNARPPPAHTLLSAAAERSSYGFPNDHNPYPRFECIGNDKSQIRRESQNNENQTNNWGLARSICHSGCCSILLKFGKCQFHQSHNSH